MAKRLLTIKWTCAYSSTDCTFCNRRIYDANVWLPDFLNEWIANRLFSIHRLTRTHRHNRPNREA